MISAGVDWCVERSLQRAIVGCCPPTTVKQPGAARRTVRSTSKAWAERTASVDTPNRSGRNRLSVRIKPRGSANMSIRWTSWSAETAAPTVSSASGSNKEMWRNPIVRWLVAAACVRESQILMLTTIDHPAFWQYSFSAVFLTVVY
jgi:hypothetical protein